MPKSSGSASSENAFFAEHTGIKTVEAFIIDANGVPRGKWLPRKAAEKLFTSGMNLPRSIFAMDIWGEDVLDAGLVTETGDPDGICRPAPETLKPVPWYKRPTAQVILSMYEADGTPVFADPRHVLQNILDRLAKMGVRPVVATELEFYLFGGGEAENTEARPLPPFCYRTGKRHDNNQLYSLSEMHEFRPVLLDITKTCAAQGIPADTVISENGPGQFEINLNHVDNALHAADHAILIKRAIKGVAIRHGLDATFMAKPYAEQSGNGLHVHISLLDEKGDNVFAGNTPEGSRMLRHAVGGLLATMRESTAIFAANANSYRRFRKGSHAPTNICWGYDNRSAAVRIPSGDLKATRIEHRVSGADANPHLVIAIILSAILHGLENKIDPEEPIEGDAYALESQSVPSQWEDALTLFENSSFVAEYLGTDYQKLYSACKRQEKEWFESTISDLEYDAYLRTI